MTGDNMQKSIWIILSTVIILAISCRDSINEPNNEIIEEEKPLVVQLKQIDYPSERVEWKQGENHDIKWTVTKNLDKVNIVLLRKYKQVAVISELTDNDGKFNWAIPNDLPGSHHYRIRLVSPYNLAANSTSVEFEIQKSAYTPLGSK
jgi:hypothetical protein